MHYRKAWQLGRVFQLHMLEHLALSKGEHKNKCMYPASTQNYNIVLKGSEIFLFFMSVPMALI